MKNPEISVIIPVKNGGSVFEECLASLRASQGVGYEIIVLDEFVDQVNVESPFVEDFERRNFAFSSELIDRTRTYLKIFGNFV